MKVTKHTPPPIPQPPVYDLTGLSEGEFNIIYKLVGQSDVATYDEAGLDKDEVLDLFNKLFAAKFR